MTKQRVRIIIVDDEPELARTVSEFLASCGYLVRTASGAAELDMWWGQEAFDLVLLDITMPGECGLQIAHRLRRSSKVPIVFLTALGEPADRVLGIEIGADDYVTKPFDLRELRARIEAVLRRVSTAEDVRGGARHLVRFGKVALDLNAGSVLHENGMSEGLSPTELSLLSAFARHPYRVLSRDHLLDLAPPRTPDPFDRSIDMRIRRMRAKVERDPARPEVLRTIRGGGYMYVPAGG